MTMRLRDGIESVYQEAYMLQSLNQSRRGLRCRVQPESNVGFVMG